MDQQRAEKISQDLSVRMSGMLEATQTKQVLPQDQELEQVEDVNEPKALSVDGYDICGILSIPAIRVQLAIISNWSYPNLTASACRYSGSPDGQMILLAHNYRGHFADLDDLKVGDSVSFTDAQGTEHNYQVTGTEIWGGDQLREIISGDDWDLTMFTCTYGGNSRIVVRCARV